MMIEGKTPDGPSSFAWHPATVQPGDATSQKGETRRDLLDEPGGWEKTDPGILGLTTGARKHT